MVNDTFYLPSCRRSDTGDIETSPSVCLSRLGVGCFYKKNHFMFSSRFVLFSTFLEKKKILGRGGVGGRVDGVLVRNLFAGDLG